MSESTSQERQGSVPVVPIRHVHQVLGCSFRLCRRLGWYLTQPHAGGEGAGARVVVRRLLRLLIWPICRLLRIEAVAIFPRYGFFLRLPPSTGVASCIFVLREDYEAELQFLADLLKLGMTFVDVGANFGIYTLLASRKVGSTGAVVAVKPIPSTAYVLRANLVSNGCQNARVVQCAAADKDGASQMYVHGNDPGSHSLGVVEGAIGTVQVNTFRLDRILALEARVDVMKIDTEGSEELVLAGALQILVRWKPIILFEISPERCDGLGLDPLGACRVLRRHGYNLYRWRRGILARWWPTLEDVDGIRRGPGRANVLAVTCSTEAALRFTSLLEGQRTVSAPEI